MLNEKYSYKNLSGRKFKHLSPDEFNNTEIKGACFYQENFPDSDIFPDGMAGVVFTNCNLDNVLIPVGNTTQGGCSRRIKVQNPTIDNPRAEDWVLDKIGNPIEPVNKDRFLKKGLSIDPKDIQSELILEQKISKEDWDETFGKGVFPKNSFYKAIPEITKTIEIQAINSEKEIEIKEIYIISGEAYLHLSDKLEVK